jgi:hypothetical protein
MTSFSGNYLPFILFIAHVACCIVNGECIYAYIVMESPAGLGDCMWSTVNHSTSKFLRNRVGIGARPVRP